MSKAKKIFIGAVAATVVGYGAYIYKDELSSAWKKNGGNSGEYQADFNTNGEAQNGTGQPAAGQQINGVTPGEENSQNGQQGEVNGELQQYLKDCDSKCVARTGDDYKYCLDICGLPQPQTPSASEDCAKKAGREKDVCYKNKAVREKNDQFCDEISDRLLKESCINAVAENILE